jgi:hypothetical protein
MRFNGVLWGFGALPPLKLFYGAIQGRVRGIAPPPPDISRTFSDLCHKLRHSVPQEPTNEEGGGGKGVNESATTK